MSRKKISTTVYLDSAQLAALRELSDRTKVPVAVFIREGVDRTLRAHDQEKPLPVGMAPGGGVS